jgi:hypothetical protein
VPLLGNLWLLGTLFQYRKTEKHKTEIVVVLVPRVVPYTPPDEMRERVDIRNATSPLLHGALESCPRRWEPRLNSALQDAWYGRAPYVYCPTPLREGPSTVYEIGEAAMGDLTGGDDKL